MLRKNFFTGEEDANLSTEMVVLIAAIGIILVVGVTALFNAMSNYFSSWAAFFAGGS